MVKKKLKNVVRILHKIIRPYVRPFLGLYYASIHIVVMCIASLILLFDTHLLHLFLLLGILSIDAMACVVLHNCPLTLLEQKYLGRSLISTHMDMCKQMNIGYTCSHEYERTIECLCNMGALLVMKILAIILLQLISFEFTLRINVPLIV
jgi:hypothetical protein